MLFVRTEDASFPNLAEQSEPVVIPKVVDIPDVCTVEEKQPSTPDNSPSYSPITIASLDLPRKKAMRKKMVSSSVKEVDVAVVPEVLTRSQKLKAKKKAAKDSITHTSSTDGKDVSGTNEHVTTESVPFVPPLLVRTPRNPPLKRVTPEPVQ